MSLEFSRNNLWLIRAMGRRSDEIPPSLALCLALYCTLKFPRPEGSWEDLRSRLEGVLLRRLSRQWVDQGTRMRSITPKKYKFTDFYICLIFLLLSNVILYKIDSSCCWFVGNPLISVDCLIDFMVFTVFNCDWWIGDDWMRDALLIEESLVD